MKTIHYGLVVLGIFFSHCAYAEQIAGTITDIDVNNNRVSLRSDTGATSVVSVRDKNSLSMLQAGNQVTFDASRRASGDWESRSVRVNGSVSPDLSPNPSATLTTGIGLGTTLRSPLPATSSGVFGVNAASSAGVNTEGSASVNSTNSLSAEKR